MAAVAIALISGRYLVLTTARSGSSGRSAKSEMTFPTSVVATMLQDALDGNLSRDVVLGDCEREAVLRALDEPSDKGR